MKDIKVGKSYIDPVAAKKMGKDKFLKAHSHLRDPEKAWAAVEKATKKEPTE